MRLLLRGKRKTDNPTVKRLFFGSLLLLCLVLALSFSVFAWFYFPMTQNTTVYTDGVEELVVEAYRYVHSSGDFVRVNPYEDTGLIELKYYNESGELVSPYFFFWDGEYTSNDNYISIYKVVVTYDNAIKAYPTRLNLFGDFVFDFWCVGFDDYMNEIQIPIRFMKLSYFVPQTGDEDFLNTENYTAISADNYDEGCTLQLGTVSGGTSSSTPYTITFYLMLETDLDAINAQADQIAEQDGLLDAGYEINLKLYCHTVPANTYNPG
ncbi:MAG: hypothetical protein GX057_00065 [Clostridiales bacterium]|nr:hypothetical protein [Clostridiales bacterium]